MPVILGFIAAILGETLGFSFVLLALLLVLAGAFLNEKEQKAKRDSNVIDYLSSHPDTQERIAQARRYAHCYRQGLTDCEASK